MPLGSHPYRIASSSMEPTLSEGDIIVANRAEGACGSTHPILGDVVLVRRDGFPWIRRVVAGPGQSVAFVAGELIVDGSRIHRESLGHDTASDTFGARSVWTFRETLPNGRQYLTWDFGPGGDLDDRPEVVVPADHWFTLGDSRDNAIDSRVNGPTASGDLCGVVYSILQSSDVERAGKTP
ncbi:signal peptidase I [Brevundimonas sp.]|uniref:signal peptidase I n=1 Tax=Brevundimonas sp. TaxID=1871086 RepID=UPI003D0BAA67